MPSDFADRNAFQRQLVTGYLERLLAGKHSFHLPPLQQLRTRHPGMHFHPTPEVFLQCSGSNVFTCPDSSFELKPQEACLIHTGLPHGEIGRSPVEAPFRNLVICFENTHLRFLESLCQDGGVPEVSYGDTYITSHAAQALTYLNRISDLTARSSPNAQLHIDGLLRAFFAIVLEILEEGDTYHRSYDIRVIRAQDIISSEISDPKLTIQSLANRLGCSADHFTRLFRQHTGDTPNQYLKRRRIQYATTLLQDPKLNLSEVAWSTGFSSLNYFSRAFHQVMNCSASAYRKRQNTQFAP
ncbi:helix-turn-helix transcriptional regulator [Pelagicoccus enzymogenes]|uniref:AraC family transcriptional regulator n=1 Tax=Pelagicoccus enzymogenes TaxID=2773457 RepID=UPI00280D7F56|nr:helix-turn-helix transcriptional regulator [Pelagicoccus enzymogenes]MDQ8201283.1 helix-turn-helix transcriptional regulator [Pelagicoccus enzymogenes]